MVATEKGAVMLVVLVLLRAKGGASAELATMLLP